MESVNYESVSCYSGGPNMNIHELFGSILLKSTTKQKETTTTKKKKVKKEKKCFIKENEIETYSVFHP
jgi:hypothetical protein